MTIRLSSYDNSDFDRGRSRWVEGCWWIVRAVFFIAPLPFPSKIRRFWLRCFGSTVGKGVVIRSGVNITFPWRLTIGDHCWIGDDVTILSLADVQIGADCCVSQQAYLCTGSHDFDSDRFNLVVRPITIGSGSWIAARAFVGPGVTIGDGCLCAAGSVVVKDVVRGEIVGGNPARFIRRRRTQTVNLCDDD